MEKELPFDFSLYHKANSICIRPKQNTDGSTEPESELVIVRSCSTDSFENDEELENRYYNGEERIYFFDIKLCHTLLRYKYRDFINELLRRGKTKTCSVHISNNTRLVDHDMVPVYSIVYLINIIKMILTIETDVIIEISNKTIMNNSSLKYKKMIDKIDNILNSSANVVHYMIREEVYKINPNSTTEDDYEHLLIEVKKHDNGKIYRYDVTNK